MPDNARTSRHLIDAFATHAALKLSAKEQEKLDNYVGDVWAMAAALREVEHPGLVGMADQLPRRSAYANVYPDEPEASRANATSVEPELFSARTSSQAPLHEWTLQRTAEAIASGEVTPLDLTRATLQRIERLDDQVRSYITVAAEQALASAKKLTAELNEHGPRSPLHGIPVGLKDNIPAAGMRCTYNSSLTKDWVPKRDAEAVRRLRHAGAVIIGKHNLNEFGWSLPGEDDFAPPPRNPWFPQEYSVGSSSGGGAAVAARLCHAALGTDGGGSTRLPAGQHLLFGLKPTHDRVPRQGVSEGSVSEVGILTRSAVDAALVLAALLVDPDSSDAGERLQTYPEEMAAYVSGPPEQLRVGIPRSYLDQVGMENDVAAAFDDTVKACAAVGFEPVTLPPNALTILHDAVRANFVVIAAEHYSDHEKPAAVNRDRYGESAGFYNLPGAFLTAADYLNALRVGAIAREQVEEVLQGVDVLLLPTSPVIRTSTARNPETHRKGGNAAYTAPFNITGHPGLSFPICLSTEGVPIGMQFIGRYGSEFDLLLAGRVVTERFTLPPYPNIKRVTF